VRAADRGGQRPQAEVGIGVDGQLGGPRLA
jgi:hypothetical protein